MGAFPGADGVIAFESADGGIYKVGAGGRGLKLLSNGFDPSWSPNGDFIVYTGQVPSGHFAIKVMRSDGTQSHIVITANTGIYEPAFSPTGGQIVYRRGGGRDSGDGDLYVVNTRGQNNHLLVKNGADPDWSEPTASAPHGTIAFDRRPDFACGGTGLFTVSPSGANEQQVPCTATSSDPSWSPTASRLAYTSYGSVPSQAEDIFTRDPTGPTQSQVTNLPGYDIAPAYSPTGGRIVFSHGSHGEGGLYLVTLRHPFIEKAIPNTKAVKAERPSWQPR